MKDLWKINTQENQFQKNIVLCFYFFTIAAITIAGFWNNWSIEEILKLVILSIILVTITSLYTRFIHTQLFENDLNCYILIGSYIFSFLCSLVSFKFEVYNLWMLGSILIALLIDTNLGINFHLLFTFLIGLIRNDTIEETAVYFILGIIGCLLSKFMTDIDKIGYGFVVFVSTNITLIFLVHNFSFEKSLYVDVLFSVLSSILVLLSVYFLNGICCKIRKNELSEHTLTEWNKPSYTKVEKVEIKGMNEINVLINGLKTHNTNTMNESATIEDLMSEEHPLNHRFYDFSPELYGKSELMGEVCFQASQKINADASLAGAGAFYHKIGKIIGSNYIEEGIKLLEENNAPQKLIDIVSQYHMKYGIPKSKEAAIVMLADSIISSIEVFEKTSDSPFFISKLVDNVMSLRLSKGSLDESELTLVELKLLQEFFTDNLSSIMEQHKKEA